MSSSIVKSFRRPLSLIPAAFLIHISGAVAANPVDHVQQQTRELLTGTTATAPAALSGVHADRDVTPVHHAQDLATRVLLGVASFAVRDARSAIQPEKVADHNESTLKEAVLASGAAQTMAQRFLLGQRDPAGTGS